MPMRPRNPGAELRDKRTSVRWTGSEYERLEKVQQRLGTPYLVDVPRIMTLRQMDLEELLDDRLESLREELGAGSTAEIAMALVTRQLDFMDAAGTLRCVDLENSLGGKLETLEKLQGILGVESLGELLGVLVLRQIEQISSALENHVAE